MMRADRRLFVDQSGLRLCEDGDPAAFSLLAAEGSTIAEEVEEELGLYARLGREVMQRKAFREAAQAVAEVPASDDQGDTSEGDAGAEGEGAG